MSYTIKCAFQRALASRWRAPLPALHTARRAALFSTCTQHSLARYLTNGASADAPRLNLDASIARHATRRPLTTNAPRWRDARSCFRSAVTSCGRATPVRTTCGASCRWTSCPTTCWPSSTTTTTTTRTWRRQRQETSETINRRSQRQRRRRQRHERSRSRRRPRDRSYDATKENAIASNR